MRVDLARSGFISHHSLVAQHLLDVPVKESDLGCLAVRRHLLPGPVGEEDELPSTGQQPLRLGGHRGHAPSQGGDTRHPPRQGGHAPLQLRNPTRQGYPTTKPRPAHERPRALLSLHLSYLTPPRVFSHCHTLNVKPSHYLTSIQTPA